MSYKWKEEERKTIDYHIKKHIINNKEEMKLWEKEYIISFFTFQFKYN